MKNMVKSLLRWARTTREGDDSKDFPVQQVGYLAKVGDSLMWFPYGMHANVPVDELVLMVSMQGNPEARVSIPGSPKKRVKPLASSEVVFFHPNTGSKLHFKANGDIEIEASKDLNVKVAGNMLADVEGNIDLDAAGNAKINAVNVDIDATGVVTIDSVGKTTIKGTGTVEINGDTLVDILASLIEASNGGAVEFLCNEAFLNWARTHTHGIGPPTVLPVIGIHTTTVLKGE